MSAGARRKPVEDFPEAPESVAARANRLAATAAQGVPSQYTSSFEWAQDWVQENGVTLPPDTPELRSLRNWFCYKMSQYKKGTLSPGNQALLEKHGIDLSKYDAPNTGRGKRLPDADMVAKLRCWREERGTYDLTEDADPVLREWQRRILDNFGVRGRSTRMREIEAQLEGFDIAVWSRPSGVGRLEPENAAWWAMARRWRQQNESTPAYRGDIDPLTPQDLADWASDQVDAVRRLSTAQVGELRSLGLLPDRDRQRLRVREAATTLLKQHDRADVNGYGYRDRNLKSYLGVCMYLQMLSAGAKLHDIYATFAITPSVHRSLLDEIDPMMEEIRRCCKKSTLHHLRVDKQEGVGMADIARLHRDKDVPPPEFAEKVQVLWFLYRNWGRTKTGALPVVSQRVRLRIWKALVIVQRVHAIIEWLGIEQDVPDARDVIKASDAIVQARGDLPERWG